MNPNDHTMTGAYAVDALPEDERRDFEAHLAECPDCAHEVDELRTTAAALGASQFEAPPSGMRDEVMARIDRVRQEPPSRVVIEMPRRRVSGWLQNMVAPAAAILAIAVVGMTVIIAGLNQRLGELESTTTSLSNVVAAPDAINAPLTGPGDAAGSVVVSPSRGEGVVLLSSMAPAPDGSIYQLWLLDDQNAAIPAGLFDVDDRGRAMRVMTGDMRQVSAIGVTVEPAGGSPNPTGDMIIHVPVDGSTA